MKPAYLLVELNFGGFQMKKFLMFAIPIGVVVALLFAAHQSYGFGRFGHRHEGMAKDFILWKMDRLGQELKLTPAQQAKWDTFKQDLEKSMDERHEGKKQIHDAVKAELAKPNPDLSKVTGSIHSQIDQTAQFAHDTVNRINELYSDLSPEQRKILSQTILERIHEREEE